MDITAHNNAANLETVDLIKFMSMQASIYNWLGNPKKSIEIQNKVIHVFEHQGLQEQYMDEYLRALYYLSNFNSAIGHVKKSEELYQKLFDISNKEGFSKLTGKINQYYNEAHLYETLSNIQYDKGNLPDAIDAIEKEFVIIQKLSDKFEFPKIPVVPSLLAYVKKYLYFRMHTPSVHYYEEIKETYAEAEQLLSTKYNKALILLQILLEDAFYQQHHDPHAIHMIQASVEKLDTLYEGKAHRETGLAYQILGDCYFSNKELMKAKNSYFTALKLYENSLYEMNIYEVERTLEKIIAVFLQMNEISQAKHYAWKLEKIFNKKSESLALFKQSFNLENAS